MKDIKVAVAQFDIKLGDKKENLKKTEEFVSKAAAQGADFIVLPEYLSTGSIPDKFRDLAEPVPGDTVNRLLEMSEEHKIYIAASIVEKDTEIYNTAILTDPKGNLLARYRKIHLFMDEQQYVANGQDIVVVDTEFGKVGLMICYDSVFPEVARKLALEGAELILVPANWPAPFEKQWQLSTNARALDNQLWIAAANRIGADDKFTYFGNSRIVSPYGIPVVECDNEEKLAVATIDKNQSGEFKSIVNFLEDRRDI